MTNVYGLKMVQKCTKIVLQMLVFSDKPCLFEVYRRQDEPQKDKILSEKTRSGTTDSVVPLLGTCPKILGLSILPWDLGTFCEDLGTFSWDFFLGLFPKNLSAI